MAMIPVTYLSGATLSNTLGMFKRGTIAQNLKTLLESGYNWWSGIDIQSNQYLIYSDTYTMGTTSQASAIPVAWSTPDLTDTSLLNLINTLPPRVGKTPFTSLPIALQWLQSSNQFFLIRTGTENIVKSGLQLYVDAGRYNSYSGTGTNWVDLSGEGRNGTLINNTTFNSTGVASMYFDGTDDYVNCGSSITTTSQITVNAWVKLNVNNIYQHVVDSSGNSWHLAVLNDGRAYFWDGSTYHTSGEILSTGRWYMITGVRTSTTNNIYVNGILSDSLSSSNSVPTNNVNIGRWQNPNDRLLNGYVANVEIYNTAISPEQVLQNFNTQKYRFGYYGDVQSGLTFNYDSTYYISYPRSGTTWVDLQGTGINSTLINGPTFSGGTTPSIVFDGSDDYTRMYGTENYNWGNQITVNCWFYNRGSNAYRGIVNNGYYYSCSFEQRLGRENSGTDLNMIVRKDLSTAGYLNMRVLRDSWNMSTLTYDGTTVKGYVNGELKATTPLTGSIYTAPRDIVVGMRGLDNFGEYFDGNISKVQIYNRALLPQEIIQNFESQRVDYYITGITTNGLVLNLDAANYASYNGSGTVWKDISGSAYDGILTNGPTYSNSGVSSSIMLDGSDDYIISNLSKSQFSNQITISIVFKLLTYNDVEGLLQFANSLNDTVPWILIRTNGSNTMSWYLNGDYRINHTILTNNVYFLDCIYDGTTWSAYKNGTLDGTYVGPIGTYSGNNFWIGNGYNGYTNIETYNVKIYNRALSGSEILQNYNAQKSRFGL